MLATPTTPQTPTETNDVCDDCAGTLRITDFDASLTGSVNASVPCGCVTYTAPTSDHCPCHIDGWPWNDGHTGWLAAPLGHFQTPYFIACPNHPQ
ncbi:hypothetical protein ACWDV4_08505 [Micromonospora sp. NPDC003197]